MTRVTVVDVAKRAGVSKSTVSLVLNDSSRVNPATAARVRDAMHELNYVPSRAARMLQSGRSRQLGIIVSDITNPYFAELVRSVTTAAAAQKLDVVTLDTNYDPHLLHLHLERLYQYRCDGLLVFTTEQESTVPAMLLRGGVPAVMLNWGDVPGDLAQLRVDYLPGLVDLLDVLVKSGHRRLAFAYGPEFYYSANLKRNAFEDVCRSYSAELEPPLYLASEARLNLEVGHDLVERLLAVPQHKRPTAVIANNDVMALSLMRALYERGLRVPDELSVAGIDDIDAAAYMTPALTTLRQPRRRMGQFAVEMLLEQQRTGTTRDRSLPVRLVLRESTGRAPWAR